MAKAKINEEKRRKRVRAEQQAPASVPSVITPYTIPYRPVTKTLSALKVARKFRKLSSVEQSMLKNAFCYPISTWNRLYLLSLDDDAPRFAGIFKYTWTKIPSQARRRMVKHWRTDMPPIPIANPRIELDDFQDRAGVVATAALHGNKLWFFATAIKAVPDEYVVYLIAHELAHVYQIATATISLGTQKTKSVERDADILLLEWGFDVPRAYRLWNNFCDQNRNLHRYIMGKTDKKP